MYKLMLVDDESEIREGLREVIDFPALGFEVVGESGTGIEALRLAETLRPDLVITDIRMPLMDGLTMARQMSRTLATVRFIILSGYDDFEYARQAIEIPTMGYLLKPISAEEFKHMLRDAKQKLDEDFEKQRDLNRLRAHFHTSLPLLRQMLLSSLLTGELDIESALRAAPRYGISLEGPVYALALFRQPARPFNPLMEAPLSEPPGQAQAIDDPELRSFAVGNIAGEILGAKLRFYSFHYSGMLAVLLFLPDDRESFAQAIDVLEEARQKIAYYLDSPTLIGVSAACADLSELPHSARQALSALNQSALMGTSQVLCITDMEPGSHGAPVVDEYALNRLGAGLKLGEAGQAREAVRKLLDDCGRKQAVFQAYRAYLLEILMVFVRAARDLALRSPALERHQSELMEQFMLCPPPEEALAALLALCEAFAATARENRASSSQLLSQRAIAYIREQYVQDDLTVEKLCKQLHVSSSYFSALFKRETRKTFVQYLTDLRMDEAIKLLVSTDMPTARIAAAVGISDPSYFSYCFKKHFGMSPSQARGRKRTP